ncbi:MAG: Na+/H+ antiporter [Acidobacteria bacterium]|nr:Na+/H+ antiporter [Acidobacteriota bacterium]
MVEKFSVQSIQLVLLGLLVMIAAVAGFARRLNISYPIVLVLAGLVAGLLPHPIRLELAPDVVFLVFLPPLLFAAAWQTSWRDFRENLISISMLAVGLVAFTVWVAAEFANRFLPEFDWRAGFLLGAVVSPTDAVAATSIARRLGLPGRVVDILEGESLVNDATGLLALELGLELVRGDAAPTVPSLVLRMVWLLGGGIAVGLLIGAIIAWFEKWINDGPVEIMISILIPFATYLAGESIKASGVIAVVACGLYLGRKSVSFFSPDTRLQAMSVWDVINFLLNGLVFVLIGLQLPYVLAGIQGYSLKALIGYGVAFSAILIAARLAWVFAFTPVSGWLYRWLKGTARPAPRTAAKFIVGWTGMRGVVALAAAVSIPYSLTDTESFPVHNLIVFLTFIVILVTLVLQGLTLPPLIRRLGLADKAGTNCEEDEARRLIVQAAIDHLQLAREECDQEAEHAVEDLLHQYEHRMESISNCGEPLPGQSSSLYLHRLTLSTVQVERATLIRLRDEDRISDTTMRLLERELDLSESKLNPGANRA